LNTSDNRLREDLDRITKANQILIDEVNQLTMELDQSRREGSKSGQRLDVSQILSHSEAAIQEFSSAVSDFKGQLSQFDMNQQEELITILKSHEQTIQKLSDENIAHKARVGELQTTNQNHLAEIKTLRSKNEPLQAEIINYQKLLRDTNFKPLQDEKKPLQLRIAELERTRSSLMDNRAELSAENQSLTQKLTQVTNELQSAKELLRGTEAQISKYSDELDQIQSKYRQVVNDNSRNVITIRELRQSLMTEQEKSNESIQLVNSRINQVENKTKKKQADAELLAQELKKELSNLYAENTLLKQKRIEKEVDREVLSIREGISELQTALRVIKEILHGETALDGSSLRKLNELCQIADMKTKLLDTRLQLNIANSHHKKISFKLLEKEHLLEQAAQYVTQLQEDFDNAKEELDRLKKQSPTRKSYTNIHSKK
jgi:chromosome segregation ATPase